MSLAFFLLLSMANLTTSTPLSTNGGLIYVTTTVVKVEYDPIWAIVVVSFSLLIICLLSVSLYFICHLYHNEKRQNYRLQKSKAYKNDIHHHVVITKSEASKTELIEDEYAAIPGDIGARTKRKHRDDDNRENDEDRFTKRKESYSFKIMSSNRNVSNIKMSENVIEDVDDYAAIDQINYSKKSYKEIQKTKVVALKASTESHTKARTKLQTRKSSQSLTSFKNSSNSTQTAYTQSIQRRYSAELEFNLSNRSNLTKRQTMKTQQHHYNQTQDDMIFL